MLGSNVWRGASSHAVKDEIAGYMSRLVKNLIQFSAHRVCCWESIALKERALSIFSSTPPLTQRSRASTVGLCAASMLVAFLTWIPFQGHAQPCKPIPLQIVYPSQSTVNTNVDNLIISIGREGFDCRYTQTGPTRRGGPMRLLPLSAIFGNPSMPGFASYDNRRLTACQVTGRQPGPDGFTILDPNTFLDGATIKEQDLCILKPSRAQWEAAGLPPEDFKKFSTSQGMSWLDIMRCRIAQNDLSVDNFTGDPRLPLATSRDGSPSWQPSRWSGSKQLLYHTWTRPALCAGSGLTGAATAAGRDLGLPEPILISANLSPLGLYGGAAYLNPALRTPQNLANLKGGAAGFVGGLTTGQVASSLGACPEQVEAASVFGGWGCSFAGGPHAGVSSGVCTVVGLAGESTYQVGKGVYYGGWDYPGTLCSTLYQGGVRGFFKCYLGE